MEAGLLAEGARPGKQALGAAYPEIPWGIDPDQCRRALPGLKVDASVIFVGRHPHARHYR